MTPITEARAARAAARQRHQDAAQALERARQAESTAAAEVERLAAEERGWLDRHARKLRDWIGGGSVGPRPEVKADVGVVVKQASARAQLAAALTAVDSFTRGECDARQQLSRAESAVRDAALAIVADEVDAEAEVISREEAALEQRRQRLRGARAVVPPSAAVRFAAPTPQDWMHIPIPQLRELQAQGRAGGADSLLHVPRDEHGNVKISAEAIAFWEQRLEALMSGAADESEPSRSAQAA